MRDGLYQLTYLNPFTQEVIGRDTVNIHQPTIPTEPHAPSLTDDLLVRMDVLEEEEKSVISGTE